MNLEIINGLYLYNPWANNRILDAAGNLSHEQLRAETNPSFGSIHNTLVHIMNWQWLWLLRWQGESPQVGIDPQTVADFATLRARWNEIEQYTQNFVSVCTEESLTQTVNYTNFRGIKRSHILWQQMTHQVNHATQHRSEVAMVLTTLNNSPGPMDFLVFVDQHQ